MLKIQISSGGQRQIVNQYGQTIAVDNSTHTEVGNEWHAVEDGTRLAPSEVLDLLTPKNETTVIFFDSTDMSREARSLLLSRLVADIDNSVGGHFIYTADGNVGRSVAALQVGLGF